MTLVRFRPSRDLLTFQEDVNQMIDNFFAPQAATTAAGAGSWMPPVDVRETESEFVIRTDLPGVTKDQIKISLVNNTLTIRGEKKQEVEEKKGSWHHLERAYGTFERSLTLPSKVQADRIKAGYTNGVLEITIPKAEEAKPREIQIEL